MPFIRLLRLCRRADVIHAHSSKAGFLTRLAALLGRRRQRVVFTPHCWSFWAAKGLERAFYVLLERLAARWCRTIVAITEFERGTGLALGVGRSEQYVVVPNGVDTDLFAAEPDPDHGRILFVGRLAPQKRPALALRSLAELERRAPGLARLEIAGDGELRDELQSLARELGIEDRVSFLGVRSDVPDLLARAHCLLLTSGYEVCPTAVLEAMAAGVPVVVTPSGGIDELVRHGETGLITRDDPEQVAGALHELLRDPERAAALGAEGRRTARSSYRRDLPAQRLHALYGEIVAEASGRRRPGAASAEAPSARPPRRAQ